MARLSPRWQWAMIGFILFWCIESLPLWGTEDARQFGLFEVPVEAYHKIPPLLTEMKKSTSIADAKRLLDEYLREWGHTYLGHLMVGIFWLNPNHFLKEEKDSAAFHNKKEALRHLNRAYQDIQSDIRLLVSGTKPPNYMEWLKLNTLDNLFSNNDPKSRRSFPFAKNLLYQLYMGLASSYKRYLKPEEALRLYDEMEAINNKNQEEIFTKVFIETMWMSKGWMYFREDKMAELQKILQLLPPVTPEYANLLAVTYAKQQRFKEAVEIYNKVLAHAREVKDIDEEALFLNNQGETYVTMFEFDKALQNFRKILHWKDIKMGALPYYNLIHLHLLQLDLDSAESVLAQWNQIADGTNEQRDNKGIMALAEARIWFYRGRLEKCFSLIETARNELLHTRQLFENIGFEVSSFQQALDHLFSEVWMAWYHEQKSTIYNGWKKEIQAFNQRIQAYLESWRFSYSAFQGMVNDRKPFDDLYIYNSESMADYMNMGKLLAKAEARVAKTYLERLMVNDTRDHAKTYYQLYQAEVFLENGEYKKAFDNAQIAYKEFEKNSKYEKIMMLTASKIKIGALLASGESDKANTEIVNLYDLCVSAPKLFGFPLSVRMAKLDAVNIPDGEKSKYSSYITQLFQEKNIYGTKAQNAELTIETIITSQSSNNFTLKFLLTRTKGKDMTVEKEGSFNLRKDNWKDDMMVAIEKFGNLIFSNRKQMADAVQTSTSV